MANRRTSPDVAAALERAKALDEWMASRNGCRPCYEAGLPGRLGVAGLRVGLDGGDWLATAPVCADCAKMARALMGQSGDLPAPDDHSPVAQWIDRVSRL